VAQILEQALELGASDVYWLPRAQCIAVRCRVNGVQQNVAELPREVGDQCLTHVKVLAGMLTYRTNIAQDGVIRMDAADGTAELRVASMPSLFGERLTIRVMNKNIVPFLLDELDMDKDVVAALRRIVTRPTGLCILTGPTGCGKTTTIYAMIRELLRQQLDPASIITLEDPIETVIDGITQTAITSANDEWDYEAGLRAALRQDVKTLVVGEMRDSGVANVVLDAALTGHRIITTYHAGDIASVYARLLHQEFEPFLVAAAITGVVAQRLVRTEDGETVPVVAVLETDDAWRQFIAERPSLETIREHLRDRPLGDLETAAQQVVDCGRITSAAARLAVG
jgi:type II secretory ATPase GspE/PulE/Tfp pilus assembly ATPase PilB-like protein